MATKSGKYTAILTLTVLVTAMMTGCSTLMPADRAVNADATGDVNGGVRERADTDAPEPLQPAHNAASTGMTKEAGVSVVVPAKGALLPSQAYTAEGVKIPYVPQPNPYTSKSDPVPQAARSMFVIADARLKKGDLAGARAKFEKLAEKYPMLSGPWVRLGAIAEREGSHDRAIEHYKKAISVNKLNVNAYLALALVQRKKGNFGDAQNTYLAALDTWRDFPEAHLNLAILYDLYANQAEAAQMHYEAYHFLTGKKDKNVHKWIVEVRHRTGIEQSFIDNPPADVAHMPPVDGGEDPGEGKDSVAAAGSPG